MNLHPDLWAQGCAACRAALENSPEGKTLAKGLAHGILLMLILPYGLMGTFGFFIFRAYRKKSKELQQDAYSDQTQSGSQQAQDPSPLHPVR
jgi:hypothetical protein